MPEIYSEFVPLLLKALIKGNSTEFSGVSLKAFQELNLHPTFDSP
ncbi:MAG: hypothetical protein RLZZ241_2368 [Bacteroidota bacterium]|jgi:hypothetical protein